MICFGGVASVFDGDETASTTTRTLADAPTDVTPTPIDSTEPSESPIPVPPSTPTPAPRKTTSKPKPAAPYYKNCDAVRDADKAPLFEGDPGYRAALDRDGGGHQPSIETQLA